MFIIGLPIEKALVGHASLESGFKVMDVAMEFFGAGRGVADWTRSLGFDYEAFGDVVGRIAVVRGRTVPLHRVKSFGMAVKPLKDDREAAMEAGELEACRLFKCGVAGGHVLRCEWWMVCGI